MKFSGFIDHCINRARLNTGLKYSTRVARIEDGLDKGDKIGLLPLLAQFLEWPEDTAAEYPLKRSFLLAKKTVYMPVSFLLPWFMNIDGTFHSELTSEELDSDLARQLLVNSELVDSTLVDLVPYIDQIFGEVVTFAILGHVSDFVTKFLGVVILKEKKLVQESFLQKVFCVS